MNPSEYIKSKIIDPSDYLLSSEDEKIIKHEGIETFIYRKLNSSKYRTEKTSPDYDEKVKDKIKLSTLHNKPIHILLPFGAYKNPNIPNSPLINWAEVFNISYLRNYLSPISKAYKPGVILEYFSGAVFQRVVNRVPISETDIYNDEFSKLIKFYQKYVPSNFNLIFSRTEDYIPREVVEEQFEKKIKELKKNWLKQPKDDIQRKLKKSERNVRFTENDDREKVILNAAIAYDAFVSECWAYNDARWNLKPIICLGHVGTEGWAIRVGSCPNSTVHFWSGIGLLNHKKSGYMPNILSASQYKKVKDKLSSQKVDVFGDSLKNLNEVLVLEN